MKILAPLAVILFFSFGMGNALSNDPTVMVNNHIVPMNSNLAGQLMANIGFSTDHQSISNGMSEMVNIHSDAMGAIVISAPACGAYLGYECFVPLPDSCMKKVGHSGVFNISGVMSEYGLDLNSLRCSFTPTPQPKPIKKKGLFHH